VRALQITSYGGPDAAAIADIPEPEAGGGVLLDVRCAGVSFPDVLLARGLYQTPSLPPYVGGVEAAGVVVAAPPESGLRAGDRVAAMTPAGGAWAQRAVADPRVTFPIPDRLGFAEGAGLVLNYWTAWFALVDRGMLRAGESVVVHGAAGGLGTAVLQVAAALGARPIAVVSTEEKPSVALRAGATDAVRSDGPWRDEVREMTCGGADMVVDPVGGDRFTDSLRCLCPGGRVVVVGFTAGAIPEVKVNRLLLRNVSVIGAGLDRWWDGRPEEMVRIGAEVSRLAETGAIAPVVGRRFPLGGGADAMRLLEGRGAVGKVVLDVEG
jgi:NADPH2:quinone reductase